MREEVEWVHWRHVKVGMNLNGYKDDVSSHYHYPPFKIMAITGAYVEIEHQGARERLSTENLYFEMPVSEDKLRDRYRDLARKLQKAFTVKLHKDEIGQHEMWNGWICVTDLYELAQTITQEDFMVVGICTDITPHDLGGLHAQWDTAVVIEYPDGERYWCHYASMYIQDFLEEEL